MQIPVNSHELLERAKWHSRKALARPPDKLGRHHARCFVLLCALARKAEDFDYCNQVMTP